MMVQRVTAEINPSIKQVLDHPDLIDTNNNIYSDIVGDLSANADRFAHVLEDQQPAAVHKPVTPNPDESAVFNFGPSQAQSLQKIAIQLQQQKSKRKQRGANESDERE